MQKELIRKGLVCSVIVLFISVGVQPIFAGESINSTIDKDEDCIECQESDRYSLLRAKLLLVRLRVIVNFISLISQDIPKVEEKYEEILDIINSNILLNPPILECANLLMKYVAYFSIGVYCIVIPDCICHIFPNLALWIEAFGYNMLEKSEEFLDIARDLDCSWTNVGPSNSMTY